MFKKLLFVAILASLIASAFSMPVPRLQDGNCPSSPARLKQADIAVVTVGDGETLNLRVSPNLNAERIVKIPAYTYVTIIAGPICDGGYRWYEVGWEGKDGWSAEVGPDGEYNMIPNGDPVPNNNQATPFSPPHDCENCPMPTEFVDQGYLGPLNFGNVTFQIENTYFVFINDDPQLRKVPDQNTFEALGESITFSCDWVRCADFIIGLDVPSVTTNPETFCEFKYRYFPNNPSPLWSPCQGILIEPPSESPCGIGSIIISPLSPQNSGVVVTVKAEGGCYDDLRAMRLLVNGSQVWEDGGNLNATWKTDGLPAGTYVLTIQAVAVGDNDWSWSVAETTFNYILTAPSLVEVPIEPVTVPTLPESDKNWFCRKLGMFCPALGSQMPEPLRPPRSPFDDGKLDFVQCTEYVQTIRPDSLCWLEQPANGNLWAKQLSSTESEYLGITHNDDPNIEDIVVWEENCSAIDNHVGVVTSDSEARCQKGEVAVIDANHGEDGKIYDGSNYTCYTIEPSCMEFIHRSTKNIDSATCIAFNKPVDAQPYCDQFSGLRKLWCKLTGM